MVVVVGVFIHMQTPLRMLSFVHTKMCIKVCNYGVRQFSGHQLFCKVLYTTTCVLVCFRFQNVTVEMMLPQWLCGVELILLEFLCKT